MLDRAFGMLRGQMSPKGAGYMSDASLDFGDRSWEQARATIFTTLQQHEFDIEGNGKAGLKEEVQDVKTEIIEIKTYAKASANWMRGLFAVAVPLLLTIAGLLVAILKK